MKSVDDILTLARSKGALSADQEKQIKAIKAAPAADVTDVQPKGEPAMSAAEQEAHDAFVREMD